MKRLGIYFCRLCSWPWGKRMRVATVSSQKPVRNYFLVFNSILSLVDTGSIGFLSQTFWGPVSQVKVLKVGAPDMGSKTLAPQGEAQSCVFPPGSVFLGKGRGSWQDRISASDVGIQCGLFLACLTHHLASFWISSRGNSSICTCRFGVSTVLSWNYKSFLTLSLPLLIFSNLNPRPHFIFKLLHISSHFLIHLFFPTELFAPRRSRSWDGEWSQHCWLPDK